MGVQLSSGNNLRRRRRAHAMSEINVTPLVDVMLVLLIIFMITAPLLTVSVPVDLPETSAQNVPADKEPLVVTVTANGVVYLQETRVPLEALARSEEHTSELQSRFGISYAVFCLK